jgi:glycerophosphoryl diester phosphodiesterase
MLLIGHRGAAGIQPENTIASLKAALAEKVDMVEFDVRVTKDKKFVLVHDSDLLRIANNPSKVCELTQRELVDIPTVSGEPIPTIDQAIKTCGNTPILLDCKGKGWATLLAEKLEDFRGPTPAVTAIDRRELVLFSQLMPHIETYVSELTKPFDAIHSAKTMGLCGVSLNFWVLHPLSYHYARRSNQKLLVYTVDHPWFARFLHFFFPKAGIITNKPDLLNKTFKRARARRK